MMRIKKRVIKIGNSLGVIFDNVIIQSLELKKGDEVTIQIIKNENRRK